MRVAGLGFRKGVSAESLAQVLALVGPYEALATVDAKAQEPGLLNLLKIIQLDLHVISRDRLRAAEVAGEGPARALYGTGSVAESAALAAAGPGARLVVARVKGPDGSTVAAVAEAS